MSNCWRKDEIEKLKLVKRAISAEHRNARLQQKIANFIDDYASWAFGYFDMVAEENLKAKIDIDKRIKEHEQEIEKMEKIKKTLEKEGNENE